MTINSRSKGKRGELQLAAFLREHGFEAKRGVQHKGGADSPDVICDVLAALGIHIECKHVEAGNLYTWLEQATRDAGPGKTPLVAHRRNDREWVAILPLDKLLEMIRWLT